VVAAHPFNPSTREAEAGRFLSSRPAWSTERVLGQPGLYRETLSQKNKTKQNKTKQKNKKQKQRKKQTKNKKQKTNKQTKTQNPKQKQKTLSLDAFFFFFWIVRYFNDCFYFTGGYRSI
jgi:DNA segregation ATPase FtsK/SpoIIIE-like protein